MTVVAVALIVMLAVGISLVVRHDRRFARYQADMVEWARQQHGDSFAEIVEAVFNAGHGWNVVRLPR